MTVPEPSMINSAKWDPTKAGVKVQGVAFSERSGHATSATNLVQPSSSKAARRRVRK